MDIKTLIKLIDELDEKGFYLGVIGNDEITLIDGLKILDTINSVLEESSDGLG